MSVRRNVIANYLGGGWAALIAIAFLPLYIRYLGIESYGLIGFFVTLQAWLFLLDMGLSPTLNREMARFSAQLHTTQSIRDLLKSMEVVYAAVGLLLAVIVATLSSWIASDWLRLKALSPETVSRAIAIMGLVISAQWMGTLYRSALLGLQHQVWLSFMTAAIATGRAVGTLAVLAFVSPTITVFLLFQCAASLVETAILGWYVHRRLPLPPQAARFSLLALKNVWRFAAGITAIAFLATLLMQVDKLLLARLLPLDQYGYFSLAVTVTSVLSLAIGPIHNVAYPRLSQLVAAGDKAALVREYHRFAQLLSITVLPAALVMSVFSREIVFLWTQDVATTQWVAPMVSVWVAGTALNGLMHIPYAAQLAHGWAKLGIIVNICAVTIMVPAVLYMVPRHGAIAAAWIWVLINAGYTIFSIAAMHSRILKNEKWPWYWQDVLKPFAASGAATLVMAVLHQGLGAMTRPTELGFLLLGSCFAAAAAIIATPEGLKLLRTDVGPAGHR